MNMMREQDPRGAAAADVAETRSVVLTANRIDSRDLFGTTREITIGHAGEVYRLRLTAQNKLLLTK